MEDYYGQYDDSIHLALQEIKYDVSCFIHLTDNSDELLSSRPYINDYKNIELIKRLLKFNPSHVIKELDILIQSLSTLSNDNIQNLIFDYSYEDEVIHREEERDYLIKRKEVLLSSLLSMKNQIVSVSNIETESFTGIKYKGAYRNLDIAKTILENDYHYINNSDDFVNIFTDQPFRAKINWLKGLNLLHYFIDRMYEELQPMNLIINNDAIWISISKTFTINGDLIDNKRIKDSDNIKASDKTKNIDKIVQILKS